MVKKWIVQYWDEVTDNFIEFDAVWDQTNEELDGDCYATFYLANTPENRLLIQMDLLVAVWFEDTLVFSGTLSGGDLGNTRIKAVIYDTVMLTLDEADTISGAYDQKPANVIAADLVAGTLIEVGDCPTTPISVVFYNVNRVEGFKFLADALNLDLYSISGTYINLGVKGDGVIWTPSSIMVSNRGLDRSKQRTKVKVRGIDCWGYHILGVAGTGTKIKTFSYNTVTDETTLNTIAAKKLAEVSTDSSGMPISVLITIGKGYLPGDSVAVVNERYLLGGTYRIKQLNKMRTKVSLQLEKFRKSIDRTIEELRSWEDCGIYLPGSTSWNLNLQGLVGLYHLNDSTISTDEGSTVVVAKDSSPIDTPVDGNIVHGVWAQGPVTMMLELAGDGYVDCGATIDFHATTKFSVGAWFSPSATDSTKRYIAHKDGQFVFSYKVSTGVITFEFTDSAGAVQTYNSDGGIAVVGRRLFVMVTHDGIKLKMYVNGVVHKTFNQMGAPHTSTNKVYIGMFLKGVIAESMFWQRCLVAQEVLELYFFPLLRCVKKGGGATGWTCAVDVSNDQHGTTTPSGVTTLAADEDLVATAYKINQAVFLNWRYDGIDNYSTANPVTVPAEAVGTHHSLLAMFTPPVGVGLPVLCQIGLLHDTKILSPALASMQAIPSTQILSCKLAAMSTVVSITNYAAAKWLLDCGNAILGTLTPSGWYVNASGATCSVTAIANTAAGIVMATQPFKLDGGAGVGSVNSTGTAS